MPEQAIAPDDDRNRTRRTGCLAVVCRGGERLAPGRRPAWLSDGAGHERGEAAGRTDLAEKQASEIELLERYLPIGLTEAQIEEIISAVLAETGSDAKDAGTEFCRRSD